MFDLAAGSEGAIGALYARYAPTVFGMAAQAVDRATAEEIVQDVFVAVWQGARTFDPEKGQARAWLLQIAHYRIANELRRRSRRPRLEADPESIQSARVPDPSPDQTQEAWQAHRREILRRALEALPQPQRQALGLAFFADLSHGEVARVLGLPLGTVKSRLRSGTALLRAKLAPLAAALLLLLLGVGLAARFLDKRPQLARDERALAMLTSSDAETLRLTAVSGVAAQTHATYRFRIGSETAVLTLSNFPQAARGETYVAWALYEGRWIPLGTARPDAAGKARLLAEGPAFAKRPDALEVTREGERIGASPTGTVVVRWPADRE